MQNTYTNEFLPGEAIAASNRTATLVGPQMSLHGIMGFLSGCSKNLLESPPDFILILMKEEA